MFNILDDVKTSVKRRIGDIDIDDCFDIDPFDGLHTEYMQIKYFRENFDLIEPLTIELDSELLPVQTGSKRRLTDKKITFQYIPLLDGLRSLLNNREILDEVLNSHDRNDGLIGDFCDGNLFKTHSLFSSSPKSLQIIAYFDEIEVCNPLGGHAGVHKLGMFYYVLGNIRPELRSTHRAVQLIACVETPHLIKYGFEKVLQPFIRDVNTLCEDGITVSVKGEVHTFHGTVLLMLGDTLASQDLGGFKVGVGFAFRICRDCMATKDMIQTKFCENDFTLRDKQTHEYHCSLLQGPLATEDSTTYGVNSNSCLNLIKHFHVTKFQLPQDVMHVILEGVLPLETRLMLAKFVDYGYFTIDFLNQRVVNFSYGRTEARNKPPKPFNKKHLFGPTITKLHLSASQMWNFAILLPLIIGDKIPLNNSNWESFLLLVEITRICTAKITSRETADYLSVLIQEHHKLFKCCYPSVSMTPKTHYMVHFPGLLTHIGPMVSTWCMRMEAKNSYFKRVAQIGNFKNLPYSIANRHQRLLCAHLQGTFFQFDELECGPCSDVNKVSEDVFQAEIKHILPQIDSDALLSKPNWINIYGEKYHRGEFVMVGFQDDDLPLFGKIKDIIVASGSMPLLVIDHYKTNGINTHISAYQIICTNPKPQKTGVIPT